MSLLHSSTLVVLAGPTGSGKTAVLEQLASQGFPVINLEKLANHKGSVFGQLGNRSPQPDQHTFEEQLKKLRSGYNARPYVFTEQEAPAIGKRRIPYWFYNEMESGLLVYLHLPKEERIKALVSEYWNISETEICTAIDRLSDRLSEDEIRALKEMACKKQFVAFADRMLDYYDKSRHYAFASDNPAIHLQFGVYNPIDMTAAVLQALGHPL